MKIKNKLLISLFLVLLIFIVSGVFVYYEVSTVNDETEKAQIAEKILEKRLARRTLVLEYIMYREERPKEQWYILSEQLKQDRSKYDEVFKTPDEQTLINDIYHSGELIDTLFEQIVTHYEMEVGSNEESPRHMPRDISENALIAQIETESLLNTHRAQQLVSDSLDSIKRKQQQLLFVITVSATLLLFFSISLFFFFKWAVARPLQVLTKVTKRFKAGDLRERVEIISNDEIGELGIAFNDMAIKLQELHRGLEKKIEDRTRDLQESKDELARLTERFIFATRAAKIGVGEWDVVNNTTRLDDQLCVLFGVQKMNSGMTYEQLTAGIHPDDKKKQEEETKLALEGKKELNTTFRVVWPNTEVHYIRAIAAVERDDTGKPLKMVGLSWDVTKEMEVDKAKSEFVSLASHQLRTPLSTINWYAEMLESGDAGPLNENQREFLKEIYVGSQRMVTLVNALLDVSRLELGRLIVDPEPIDMVSLAKTIIAELKPLIEKNQLTLTEKYEENLSKANMDPKLVSIVFQNLLTNAVKYSKEKGNIEFSIELKNSGEQVGEQKVEGDSFLIKVKDNGIGIPVGQQEKIFTKLFRADNAREQDQDGTGLGLYIVKEIVDIAKGATWYVSKVGEGTIFYVLFPVAGMSKSEGQVSLH
ncbi:MAG TPA: ATP-binding protein [Candidatus Paceibacterota bacterium]|nr:ATP-binding protein [Candidatus Paceibacterota bacterium]